MNAVTEGYHVDELRFHLVELELHNVMWFSTLTQPHLSAFVQTMIPVMHNYPLTLALEGHITEESYISKHNEYKNTNPPASRFKRTGVYAYPMQIERMYYRKLLLSMSETDYLVYKLQTRLAVPILAMYNALAPGTRGWTVVVTKGDVVLPRDLYLRLGAKRYGVWRAVSVVEARASLVDGVVNVSTPFNVADVLSGTMRSSTVVLKHYAGDVAVSGTFIKSIKIQVGRDSILKPIPFFISP